MALASSPSYNIPGSYIIEGTFGAIPASLPDHSAVYMMGYSSSVVAPRVAPPSSPTLITSLDDFVNVVGASASVEDAELFFAQRSGCGLWFVNVQPKATYTLTITNLALNTPYTVTIAGYPVSYTAEVGDTSASVLAKIAELINSTLSHSAQMTGNVVRAATNTTVTVSSGIVSIVGAAPPYPSAQDVANCINTSFDPTMRQGFLIAPEFFKTFSQVADHTILAMAMQALTSDSRFNWMALADCSRAAATSTAGAGAINLVQLEYNNLSSPRGHLAYFFPYWKNGRNNIVPMSASVAGVALRRYREEGFKEPPAGTKYPVYGVTDTSILVTDFMQDQLNPLGVNCGRKLPRYGTVIYGSRTVSKSFYYQFITTRVIMNVVGRALKEANDELVFTSTDGEGLAYLTVMQTNTDVCERYRRLGALYGATPEEAYLVVCGKVNNDASALENGNFFSDVVVKPSPIKERIGHRVTRASIGANIQEFIGSGDTGQILDLGKELANFGSVAGGNPSGR